MHILDTPIASKTIYISSRNADKYNVLNTDLSIILRDAIGCGMNQSLLLSIRSATIPYSWYNFNELNNKIRYGPASDTSEFYEITIRRGNYSAYQLAHEIASRIFAQSHDTIKITYSMIRNTFTYTIPYSATSRALKFYWSQSTASYNLGEFEDSPANDRVFNVGTSYESFEQLQLFPISNIYVRSDIVSGTGVNNEGIATNILEVIPISSPPFGVIYFRNDTGYKLLIQNKLIDSMRIRLEDQDGNLIDLNGKHWQMAVQIDTIYTSDFREELSHLPSFLRQEYLENVEAEGGDVFLPTLDSNLNVE
jgi:hypothetical protein